MPVNYGTGVCGLGSQNLPAAGDPDLNSPIVTATSGYQGIFVSWTYPTLNPHAVAHVRLYRSTSNDLGTAVLLRTVTGDSHFDRDGLTEGVGYYYWIRVVSIYGTVGDALGPGYAVLQPGIDQLIAILEGQITESVLYQDLKTKINEITNVSSALSTEEQNRLLGDDVLSQLMATWATDLAAVDTLVQGEILQRVAGDDALVAQVNTILAQSNNNAAAIQTEQVVRADADTALAASITTVQSTVNGYSASIQTMQTAVDGVAAQYTVKLDVNGKISGIGLMNDGVTSQFIVNTDTFAVSTPGEADVFPFIIGQVNGVTQIALNAATLIPDAHISNAMISDSIQSNGYSATSAGWQLHKTTGLTIRGAGGALLLSSPIGGSFDIPYAGISGGPPANADVTNYDDLRVSNNQLDGGVTTISRPQGGSYSSGVSGTTGAIVITLPQSWTHTMMKFEVDCFVYGSERSFTAKVGGYNSGAGSWINEFAQIIGSIGNDNRVRFGHNGTNCVVVIGETTSIWPYLRVAVKNFQAGYVSYAVANWDDGWSVSVIASLTGYTFTGDFSDALLDARSIVGQGALATEDAADYSSQVAGGPPINADNTASNTAAAIANQGNFATLNQINTGNISTFMAAAAIGEAYIDDLSVGTAKIQGQAVTVMEGVSNTSDRRIATAPALNTPYEINSKSITVTGANATSAVFVSVNAELKSQVDSNPGVLFNFDFHYRILRGATVVYQSGTLYEEANTPGSNSRIYHDLNYAYVDPIGALTGVQVYTLEIVITDDNGGSYDWINSLNDSLTLNLGKV